MKQSAPFLFGETHPKEDFAPGMTRQILGYNHELMMVKVWFDEGAIGYAHDHVHSQVAYVVEGEFEVMVNNEIKLLKAGDCFYVEPHMTHGAVCKKRGILIDTFSPVREDLIPE